MQQWKLIFILLILALITVWLAIVSVQENDHLQVIACDVGQGDSFLIQKGSVQILVDGGLGSRAIDCLSRYVFFLDRTIEVIVLTHPEADHAEGLIDVVRRYDVDYFVGSEFDNSSQVYQVLKKEVGGRDIEVINPMPQRNISIGMIYLDILFPLSVYDDSKYDVLGSKSTEESLNKYSIVFELRYKNFKMLFTGDIQPENMQEIISSGVGDVDVIKVPHHGSKNGLTEELLEASTPELAIISAGKNNRYGHPHKEILEMLKSRNIKILRTDQVGDIVLRTDGIKNWY